jgi:hypothetical protein
VQVFLFLNTTDTYERLPVKVIGSFQWLSAHVRYKYVLKTDDDAWVCLHELLRTLSVMPRTRLYWGKMNERHALVSNVTHHGFVHSAFTAYFGGAVRYSTYAFGAAYVLSADVAHAISGARGIDAAEHVQIEDVLVGELIRRTLGPSLVPRQARKRTISLGYTRHKEDTSPRHRATKEHLLRLCRSREAGGKESIVVHRIMAKQVRQCHFAARQRCACDDAPHMCTGRPGWT